MTVTLLSPFSISLAFNIKASHSRNFTFGTLVFPGDHKCSCCMEKQSVFLEVTLRVFTQGFTMLKVLKSHFHVNYYTLQFSTVSDSGLIPFVL